MRTFLIAGAGLLLPLASIGLAADAKPFDQKLGLWETITTMETDGMPPMPARQMPQIPKETLDKMPAAQRAKIEEMMKIRAEGSGAPGSPRTMTTKSCTTKESLAKSFGVPEAKGVDCKRDVISSSASKIQLHVVCTPAGGGPASNTDVTMNRLDAEHVTGMMLSKTSVQDKPINMKMTFNSKWIATDCGDVKPYTAK